jgi:hypothetical protein
VRNGVTGSFDDYLRGYASFTNRSRHAYVHQIRCQQCTEMHFISCRRDEISPLNGLTKTAKERAKSKNNSFIAQRRCNARTLLQRAFDVGSLPVGVDVQSQQQAFSGAGTSSNPVYFSSDED